MTDLLIDEPTGDLDAQQDSSKITWFRRKRRIELESEVGGGTSFRVILPMHYA